MDFTEELDAVITRALESEAHPYSVEEVVFALGQAELNLRMAAMQNDDDDGDAAAE
jgi:hypothetical protein